MTRVLYLFLVLLLVTPTRTLHHPNPTRRETIRTAASTLVATPALVSISSPAGAVNASATSSLLSDRLYSQANTLRRPTFSLTLPDLIYDDKFAGTWDVTSKTLNISAPCGIPLFGGQRNFDKAQSEIGDASQDLLYRSRFIPGPNGAIIADREYNVRQIASSSMGPSAVLSMNTDRLPNELTLALRPGKANGTLFNVDMLTTGRKYEKSEVRECVTSLNPHCFP